MRGIPSKVWSSGTKVMVQLGKMNMPLGEPQCKELFGREPYTEEEARRFAFRLNLCKRQEVEFPNIRTKNDVLSRKEELERRKRRRNGIVQVELNNVVMEEGKSYPSERDVQIFANETHMIVKGFEWDDKFEKLTIKLSAKRLKDIDGQKELCKKVAELKAKFGIKDAQKVTYSDD